MRKGNGHRGTETQRKNSNFLIRPAHRRALREFGQLRVAMLEQLACRNVEGAADVSKKSQVLAKDICEDLVLQLFPSLRLRASVAKPS